MKRYENEAWRKEMLLGVDMNHTMADYSAESRAAVRSQLRRAARTLSGKELASVQDAIAKLSSPPGRMLKANFIEKKEMEACRTRLQAAGEAVAAAKGDIEKGMAWTELPTGQSEVVAEMLKTAAAVRERFDAFVVLGIGGSALGPLAVQTALNDLHYNELSRERRGGPKLYIEDNVDPERMVSLLNLLDLETTCFNVISKSGNTSETMSQFMIITDLLKQRFGKAYSEHIIVTTGKTSSSNLRKIADADGLTSFVVPDGVGGRFSEMSPVGLLAAAVTGIDIEEMLAGAEAMRLWTESADYNENPALFAAGAMYLLLEKGLNISVMMPYSDSLKYFADWYSQLHAESLGKCQLRDGTPLAPGVGQTPVKALGVTDQHSQVQLYAEGPNDKVLTFLAVGKYRASITIPVACEDFEDVAFLTGHTLNELIDVERRATEYALLKSAKPSWTITLPEVNAFTVGQLMYFFQMMTSYMGELLDIDAFDQPGVEEGKNATYAIMGRKGYDAKRTEIEARLPAKKEYLF